VENQTTPGSPRRRRSRSGVHCYGDISVSYDVCRTDWSELNWSFLEFRSRSTVELESHCTSECEKLYSRPKRIEHAKYIVQDWICLTLNTTNLTSRNRTHSMVYSVVLCRSISSCYLLICPWSQTIPLALNIQSTVLFISRRFHFAFASWSTGDE
jgi:hypothetical protein